MADLLERLEDMPCDREPFTPDHADCKCRLAHEALKEILRLRRIEVAARDIANTLNGGFVVCQCCGDQETTSDIDYLKELNEALK